MKTRNASLRRPRSSELRSSELTSQQVEFVHYFVREGLTQTEAASRAGYSHPRQAGYELMHKPHISAAIRDAQRRLLDCELATMGLSALRGILERQEELSKSVSGARVVIEAAKVALDRGGLGSDRHKRDQVAEVENEEPDIEALEAEVNHLKQLAKKAEDAEFLEIESQVLPPLQIEQKDISVLPAEMKPEKPTPVGR